MAADLRDQKLDIAIALTEGLVSDLVRNADQPIYKIIGAYTDSPLNWAIVAHPQVDSIKSVSDLDGKKFGISRFGSGSHIMSFLLAEKMKWRIPMMATPSTPSSDQCIDFIPVGGLSELRKGIANKSIDCFMWEHYMLKHFVDMGEFKLVGNIVTPWPCFLIAARKEVLSNDSQSISKLLLSIQECCQHFRTHEQDSIKRVATLCQLTTDDATTWVNNVRFASKNVLAAKELENCMQILKRVKVIEQILPADQLYDNTFQTIQQLQH